MDRAKSKYAEQGTSLSGYVETGKQYCGDCVHRDGDSAKCVHPVVIVDPELSGHKHGPGWVEVDLVKGCCKFVKIGPSPANPVFKAATSSK